MHIRHDDRVSSNFAAPGWTLTELLMVLAILGILSALAIPTYQQQQRKVRRSDARAALQQLQFDQARHRGARGSFASTMGELGWNSDQSPQGHYRLHIVEASADGFMAEAMPTGSQLADTHCTPIRLTWRQTATVVYSSGASLDSDPAQCWP